MIASQRIKNYYKKMEEETTKTYAKANAVRAKGFDPETEVEIALASDIYDRVEGLTGLKGIAKKMRDYSPGKTREEIAMKSCEWIINGDFGEMTEDEMAETSIRVSLTLMTEGVVVAPIEGISKARVEENPDGSRYLTIFYAGPIRSAGGTGQVLSILLADYTRKLMGLSEYRPTDTELERYVEEINLYHSAVARLQYQPSEEEIKLIVKNCPVCISGDPTAQVEVDVYKNLERIPTNRIRGGMALVIGEGVAQKAQKVIKLSKLFGLDWEWLKKIIKSSKSNEGKKELKPITKFIKDVVAGRPIIGYPMAKGGFRLRYGRGRNTGMMTKAIHPATMHILAGFPAIGTQFKVERPGKGMTVVPCTTIDGPVVRLKDGSVIKIDDSKQAKEIEKEVNEILSIGDLLVSFGDFQKSNHPIVPSPWVEEWWQLELEKNSGGVKNAWEVDYKTAKELSQTHDIPLHPKFVFNYHDVELEELKKMVKWLAGEANVSEEKRVLEKILVPHKVVEGKVVIDEEYRQAVFETLGLPESAKAIDQIEAKNSMELVNELAPFEIKEKSPLYVGARMGRPEKAKERLMSPAPHILYPVGNYGGNTRSIMKAYEKNMISVEVPRRKCPKCGKITSFFKCECGERTELSPICPSCGKEIEETCPACGLKAIEYEKRMVNIKEELKKAISKVGKPDIKFKGVKGTISSGKNLEPLEKGIIRSRNHVYLFKDGTIRIDSTNLPLTHFKPREIGTSVERLREMGYEKDIHGKELVDGEQILEMFPQDVVPSTKIADYMLRITYFIDELLQKFYDEEAHYNCENTSDLIGQLIIELAPHTGVGVLGRVIGFSKAHGCYQHPLFVAGTRRDCDGDENGMMLLMDALLNFSKHFLPSTRGGTMDTPLVLTSVLDPSQVDDQVHEMDVVYKMDLDFYRTSHELRGPSDYKVELVGNRLGKENQYDSYGFTHDTYAIDEGVEQSSYTKLDSMQEKVDAQLSLGRRIRAVDEKDAATRLLNSHFLRDIYGNLRAFGEQQVRCVDCNTKYRRVPLVGKCTKCGGKLILTIAQGSVRKYLEISQDIARKYGLSDYMNQRLKLVENNINSVFINDKSKQYSIADFI